MFHFIFDYNCGNFWQILTIFLPLEIGMNTLRNIIYKLFHFNLTMSPLYLVKLKRDLANRRLSYSNWQHLTFSNCSRRHIISQLCRVNVTGWSPMPWINNNISVCSPLNTHTIPQYSLLLLHYVQRCPDQTHRSKPPRSETALFVSCGTDPLGRTPLGHNPPGKTTLGRTLLFRATKCSLYYVTQLFSKYV